MEDHIKRLNFYQLFNELPDRSFTPKYIVIVNGVTFGPGVAFGPGVSFGGTDLYKLKGEDLAVEAKNENIYEIKGYFPNETTNQAYG